MATSVTSICRQALFRIGANIDSFSMDGTSAEEKACKLWYEQCRDALLTEAPWPFATKTATLNRLAGVTPLRREFAYTLPIDCLKVLEIWNGAPISNPESRTVFEYEQSGGVRVLVTDADEVSIVYTARVEDPIQFPPLFVDALSWGLGVELCIALEKGSRVEYARGQYQYALSHAASVVLNEIPLDPDPLPRRIVSRGGW